MIFFHLENVKMILLFLNNTKSKKHSKTFRARKNWNFWNALKAQENPQYLDSNYKNISFIFRNLPANYCQILWIVGHYGRNVIRQKKCVTFKIRTSKRGYLNSGNIHVYIHCQVVFLPTEIDLSTSFFAQFLFIVSENDFF